MMVTKPRIVASALDILAGQIDAPDDIPSATLREAADHVRRLDAIKAWWDSRGDDAALAVLMQDIP